MILSLILGMPINLIGTNGTNKGSNQKEALSEMSKINDI